MFRTLLVLLVLIPHTVLYYLLIIIRRPKPYTPFMNYLMGSWCRTILRAAGVKVEISGLQNLDTSRSFLLLANHQSAFDIPVLGGYIPATVRFMSKKEVFKVPLLGRAMKFAGIISIDRENRVNAIRSIKNALEITRNNSIGLIGFPEGTRSLDGKVKTFKKGLFMMAIDGNLPIIPVSISGAHNILKKKSIIIHSGKVKLHIHPPVDTSSYSYDNRDELVEKVRQIIISKVSTENGKRGQNEK